MPDKYLRLAGGVSMLGVGVLAVMMLCPLAPEGASAADTTTKAVLTNAPSLSVSVVPEIVLQPLADNPELAIGSATMTAQTNNRTGYTLSMTTDGKTDLYNHITNTKAIESITADTVGTAMTGNTWGYALGTADITKDSTFKKIQVSNSGISSTTAPSTDSLKLGFAAHITNDLPAGEYSNTITISVIANEIPPDLSTISTMQQMTSSVCANTAEGYEKQLTDTRDNKSYWVAKLADGNCWMTQNLAYEFVEGTILKPSDSDVTSNWTVPENTLNIGDADSYENSRPYTWYSDDSTTGKTGHESRGNYYSWNAAVAESGTGLTIGDATSSICSSGWKLPSSGDSATNPSATEDTFARLLTQYGVASSTTGIGKDGKTYDIYDAPLYFTSGTGIVAGSYFALAYEGYSAYWSRSLQSESFPYLLMLSPSSVVVSDYDDDYFRRYTGLSVRCVAR